MVCLPEDGKKKIKLPLCLAPREMSLLSSVLPSVLPSVLQGVEFLAPETALPLRLLEAIGWNGVVLLSVLLLALRLAFVFEVGKNEKNENLENPLLTEKALRAKTRKSRKSQKPQKSVSKRLDLSSVNHWNASSSLALRRCIALRPSLVPPRAKEVSRLMGKSLGPSPSRHPLIPSPKGWFGGELEICMICNTYGSLDPGLRLPATPNDAAIVRQLLLSHRGRVDVDLTVPEMRARISRCLEAGSRKGCPCFIYLSMHGVGGLHQSEYLVGNEGELLPETELRQLLNQHAGKLPAVVFMVDACHAGGLLNLPHTFTYDDGGRVWEASQVSDDAEGEAHPVDASLPCLLLTAVKEDQEAQASTEHSIFTKHLAETNASMPQCRASLHSVMSKISRSCNEIMHQHQLRQMNPIVSFNDAFVRHISTHNGRECSPYSLSSDVTLCC